MSSNLVAPHSQILDVERARELLALARTTDEVKDIRDKAEAMRKYLRQQRASFEAQNDAAEIKLRAERRLGELSAEMSCAPRGGSGGTKGITPETGDMSKEATLREQGIAPQRAREWEKIADLPEDAFEGYIADTRDDGCEITTVGALKLARKLDPPAPAATPDLVMKVAKSLRLSPRTREGLTELASQQTTSDARAVLVGAIDALMGDLLHWRQQFEETSNGTTESQDDFTGDRRTYGGEGLGPA